MAEPYKIYTLHDPDTMAVRYVGFTSKTLENRLNGHINESKREHHHKAKWVRSLLATGRKPLILLVETVTSENWKDRERFWIDHFRKTKCKLTNSCDGGEGTLNPSDDVREKIAAAQRGKKISEHHRLRIKAAQTGRIVTDETRSRMRAAQINRPSRSHSREARAKIALGQLGKKKTAEHRQKISAARMGISLSTETRSKISESKRKPLKDTETGVIYDCYRSSALALGVSESTIWRLIRSGKLNHVSH